MTTPGRPTRASKIFAPAPQRRISVTKIAIDAIGNTVTSTTTNQLRLSHSSAGHKSVKPDNAPLLTPNLSSGASVDPLGPAASEAAHSKTKTRYEKSVSVHHAFLVLLYFNPLLLGQPYGRMATLSGQVS